MGVINQPNSQIRLTNVSLVRMKKGKKRFEIACYQNKVQDWRQKVEKELDEVIQIPQVFLNVSKGHVASNDDLKKSFGTVDQDKIILEILEKGELQLNEKERNANMQQKSNEFLTIISTKTINPKSKKIYPPSMIQKALNEIKFHVNPNKPAKLQALEAMRALIAQQIIPIARAQMKVKISLSNSAKKQVYEEQVKPLIDNVESEEQDSKSFELIGIVDPMNYRALVEVLEGEETKSIKGECSIEVMDMTAVKD